MVGQVRACLLAESGYDVDNPWWKPNLGCQACDLHRGKWSLLSGFRHDGISHCQAGCHTSGEDIQRVIPGDNVSDHAQRLNHDVIEDALRNRHNPPVDFIRPSRVVLEIANRGAQLIICLLERLPVFQRKKPCQAIRFSLDFPR
jgi:hypothetical protein